MPLVEKNPIKPNVTNRSQSQSNLIKQNIKDKPSQNLQLDKKTLGLIQYLIFFMP